MVWVSVPTRSMFVLQFEGHLHQRCVLLCAVHIGFAQRTRWDRADDGGLDGLCRVEVNDVDDVFSLDMVEFAEHLFVEDVGVFHFVVSFKVFKNDVECKFERA